jgi:hypothetical protein
MTTQQFLCQVLTAASSFWTHSVKEKNVLEEAKSYLSNKQQILSEGHHKYGTRN